ncbi:MFS transporter [Mycolicibacterium baixiangningiae]|uniref:MFS transporter n=1 Tax=Mycolicibacterium baixiangningiae TaxID=2761578 RepID=UPI0018D0F82E|nr:MFS transporter [Mycolicibacterium baixiangningiae]
MVTPKRAENQAAGPSDAVRRPPSLAEQAAFGAGGLSSAIFTTVPGLVLLYYLTDTLGVAAGLAGLVVAVPRLLDLLSNPMVGRLSDRTTTRWGPRRPWMVAGGLLLPLTFVLLFWSPWLGNAAAIWVACAFAAGGVCFAMFAVPWSTLPAEIGITDKARTTMMSWRVAFQAIGILIAGGLAPTIVEWQGGGTEGYRLMALFMAALIVLAVTVAVFLGARRSAQRATAVSETGSLRDAARLVRSNPALRTVLIVVILCEAAAATSLASVPYIADHVVGSPDATTYVFISVIVPMLLTMPLWSRIANRHTKRTALRWASIVFAVGAAVLLALPFTPPESRLIATLCATVVLGVGFAGTSMLPLAMLADAVAREAATSGLRRAGLLTGAANAAETVSGSLGAGLYALVLSAFGYHSYQPGQDGTQTMTAQIGIVAAVGGVSILALLAVNVVLRRDGRDGTTESTTAVDQALEPTS